jgi:hypothetical protein
VGAKHLIRMLFCGVKPESLFRMFIRLIMERGDPVEFVTFNT